MLSQTCYGVEPQQGKEMFGWNNVIKHHVARTSSQCLPGWGPIGIHSFAMHLSKSIQCIDLEYTAFIEAVVKTNHGCFLLCPSTVGRIK